MLTNVNIIDGAGSLRLCAVSSGHFLKFEAATSSLQLPSAAGTFVTAMGRYLCDRIASYLPVSGRAELFHLAGTAPHSSHRSPLFESDSHLPVTLRERQSLNAVS